MQKQKLIKSNLQEPNKTFQRTTFSQDCVFSFTVFITNYWYTYSFITSVLC